MWLVRKVYAMHTGITAAACMQRDTPNEGPRRQDAFSVACRRQQGGRRAGRLHTHRSPTCIVQVKPRPQPGPAKRVELRPLERRVQLAEQIQHGACSGTAGRQDGEGEGELV